MSFESNISFPPIPEGALPGQFCTYHVVTDPRPDGTGCVARMFKGYEGGCPFISVEHAIGGTAFLGIEPRPGDDGVCRDFRPRTFGPDADFQIS
jgi:hypothetical protein